MAKVGLLDEHGVWDPGAYDASPMPTAKPAQPSHPSQPSHLSQGITTSPNWPKPVDYYHPEVNPFLQQGDYQGWFKSLTQNRPASPATLAELAPILTKAGFKLNPNAAGQYTDFTLPNGQIIDPLLRGGEGGWQWLVSGGGGAGGAGGSGGIFTDPATAHWESALNGLASRLQQPQQNPDYQPYVDYLRKYVQQLQQPAYSPSEMDLLQTQALDPLTRQRDAARKQSTERLAARGISPSSGITEQSMRDIENRYGQLATQQRGAFATNAINQNREQAGRAAQVGSALNQLETARTATDESRALQALSLLFQVPQYADTRLGLANQTLMPTNPLSALSLYPSFANIGLQQNAYDQQFWSQLAQTLVRAYGG